MKTAEEWITILAGDTSHITMVDSIKAIQLDAIKSALEYAAKVCVKEFVGTNDGFVAKHACEQAILTAAQNPEQVMKEIMK